MIKSIRPEIIDAPIHSSSDIFRFLAEPRFKAGLLKNHFIKLNLILPLSGTVAIFLTQLLLTYTINMDAAYMITSVGLPVILLLIRAELGSRKLKTKHCRENFPPKYFHSFIKSFLLPDWLFLCFLSAFQGSSSKNNISPYSHWEHLFSI